MIGMCNLVDMLVVYLPSMGFSALLGILSHFLSLLAPGPTLWLQVRNVFFCHSAEVEER